MLNLRWPLLFRVQAKKKTTPCTVVGPEFESIFGNPTIHSLRKATRVVLCAVALIYRVIYSSRSTTLAVVLYFAMREWAKKIDEIKSTRDGGVLHPTRDKPAIKYHRPTLLAVVTAGRVTNGYNKRVTQQYNFKNATSIIRVRAWYEHDVKITYSSINTICEVDTRAVVYSCCCCKM